MKEEKGMNSTEKIKILQERIVALEEIIQEQNSIIDGLKSMIKKNSTNSSMPPSTDGLKKINRNKSLRKKSTKKQGGQKNHEGHHLVTVAEPDEIKQHMPEKCVSCPKRNECLKKASVKNSREVVDIITSVKIVRHDKMNVSKCPLTGEKMEGKFPEDVRSSIQYGNDLRAFITALNVEGGLGIKKIHDIIGNVYDIPISTGCITSIVSRCAEKIKTTVIRIKDKLLESEVLNCDETGIRTEGRTQWVHSASNDEYTYMTVHQKRGQEGMKSAEILQNYNGIIVHDFWKPYYKFDNLKHGLCNAHLLRELKGILTDDSSQTWAAEFKKLLLDMKKAVDYAKSKGKAKLSSYYLKKFSKEYERILETAYAQNPKPLKENHKRGRVKKGKVLCLIERLDNHRVEVCLFTKNFEVPFDNNQAERDIRIIKVKNKICGCFRTQKGAEEYLTINSFLSTVKKKGINILEALSRAFSGHSDFIFD